MKATLRTRLLAATVLIAGVQFAGAALATPALDASHGITGATVSGLGTASTTVNQTAGTAKIYWSTIDTTPNESLNFKQPSSNSVAINYVTDGQVTNFQGSLNANGKVVLINPDGMTFAAGSQINVGALTASTAGTVTFNSTGTYAGDYTFSNFGNGAVNFNGTVNAIGKGISGAPNSGYVFAIAKQVNVGQTGSINADNGLVDVEAGSKSYIVDLNGDGRVLYDNPNLLSDAQISVVGNITAQSGDVIIRARASDITSGVINLSGVVDTSSFGSTSAGGVTVVSSGNIDITGSINAGGYIPSKSGSIAITSLEYVDIDGTTSTANGGNNLTGYNIVINGSELYSDNNYDIALANSVVEAYNSLVFNDHDGLTTLQGKFTSPNIYIYVDLFGPFYQYFISDAQISGKVNIIY